MLVFMLFASNFCLSISSSFFIILLCGLCSLCGLKCLPLLLSGLSTQSGTIIYVGVRLSIAAVGRIRTICVLMLITSFGTMFSL